MVSLGGRWCCRRLLLRQRRIVKCRARPADDRDPMRIYVDADACPVKDEVYRVAARYGLPVSVVAVAFIRVPSDPMIERVAAGTAMDAADDWIAQRAGAGD